MAPTIGDKNKWNTFFFKRFCASLPLDNNVDYNFSSKTQQHCSEGGKGERFTSVSTVLAPIVEAPQPMPLEYRSGWPLYSRLENTGFSRTFSIIFRSLLWCYYELTITNQKNLTFSIKM